jgi:hypothetical protein
MIRNAYQIEPGDGRAAALEFLRLVAEHTGSVKPVVFS